MITRVQGIMIISFIMVMMSFYKLSAQTKILFIPLDDRASSWQFPQKMALIADAEVIIPPSDLLGRFFTPGNSEEIIKWIEAQDLDEYDAAIISLDMIAYGGLVGSRTYNVPSEDALTRIRVLERMRAKSPKLKIYAQNVIMRLALTGNNENTVYYGKFTEWATLANENDKSSKARVRELAKQIPAKVIADYYAARSRNLATNLLAVEFLQKGIIDYLILSQDDASPKGIHIADRQRLRAEIRKRGLDTKAAIQPGADEVAMLLLARVLNEKYNQKTKVKAIYSSIEKSNEVMPFEDQPLKNTVSYHIAATGSTEVHQENEADVLFFVFVSRNDEGRAESFIDEIEKSIKDGRRVIVADIDPIGNIQGGDSVFSEGLRERQLFSELSGYASWNTAGNTIGTALPHGVIFTLAEQQLMNQPERARRIWTAQNWFLIHRVMDDFYFHNLIRKESNAFAKQVGSSSRIMSEELTAEVETYASERMNKRFSEFTSEYYKKKKRFLPKNIPSYQFGELRFRLPWNRTFEAEIDFDIVTATEALASGTFWQLGSDRLSKWTDQQLANEVGVAKRAGMDIIIIQYSALWNKEKQAYQTYIPNDAFNLLPNAGERDPLSAIFKAAEREGVKIILGDFLTPPDIRYVQPQKAFDYWLAQDAMNFRSTIINRYKDSPSFYGYYIANEPDPHRIKTELDVQLWIESTKKVVAGVKEIHPGLKVIHSIGLYAQWHQGGDGVSRPSPPSTDYLDEFWRPWINKIGQVDIWMMIDGIGTSLSVPSHTDGAQAWGKQLVHSAKKEFWVDVENAVMTSKFYPFSIQKLVASLDIAARHADRIVLFEHLSYMSPNRNAASKKLYEEYINYRNKIRQ